MIRCKLFQAMAARNIRTIIQLSRMSGVSKKSIGDMVRMKTNRFHGDVLDKLCKTLNCQVGDILEYVSDPVQIQEPTPAITLAEQRRQAVDNLASEG